MPAERIITRSVSETRAWAEQFGCTLKDGDVIALTGELGAGKTVIAKGIGRALAVQEDIISPTFNYMLEYKGRIGFVHGDMYRLENSAHFIAMGFEEYFTRGGVIVLEWAERVREVIPEDAIWITVHSGDSENERVITVERSRA